MTYRKRVDAQLAHIKSLRLVIGLLIALGLYMAYGWQSAPPRPDHSCPARPAFGQHPAVVGCAARVGVCLWPLYLPADEPLALER